MNEEDESNEKLIETLTQLIRLKTMNDKVEWIRMRLSEVLALKVQ